MTRDSFRRAPEKQHIALIDVATMRKAEHLIEGCEECSDLAEVPFDSILDCLNDSDTLVTDYLLEKPAKCPKCFREIREKTLVAASSLQIDENLT